MNTIVKLAAEFGQWLENASKDKSNAIILAILSIIGPIGFIFASSLIALSYTRSRKKK